MTIRRHYRPFYLALVTGLVVLATAGLSQLALGPEIAALTFFLVYLALGLPRLIAIGADALEANARQDDAPVAFIVGTTIGIVVLSTLSLFHLLNAGRNPLPLDLFANIAAVFLGWVVIHTLIAHHYAFEFYRGRKGQAEGLGFPDTPRPAGMDFLYFSFVIGMTAQTADVDTKSAAMRRLVLLHGIFSFFFNTVIIAAAVNVVVSLSS